MIILIGPSASGKTSIAKELIEKYNFKKFVTNTTRKMRVGEINDIDYHFITKEQFLDKLKNNMLNLKYNIAAELIDGVLNIYAKTNMGEINLKGNKIG